MNKISVKSKYLLIFASVLIGLSLYFPIWRIDLDAPQYPEGLRMLIYHNKLGGDVEIINGLNHYIGMKTLHAEEFVEFSILVYIFSLFAILSVVIAFIGSRGWILILLIFFGLFGCIAMYDFWRWEYEYGHNLDPKAAIIVPGMAYQPPLIGFKQLLNFGAYSIPDIGGWCLLLGGLFILASYLLDGKYVKNKFNKKILFLTSTYLALGIISCNQAGPEAILLHKDICVYCKMTISNGHFAAEAITEKGKIYKFDDIKCMLNFQKEKSSSKIKFYYVNDYLTENKLIPAETAFYILDEEFKSPMNGNTAAFKNEEECKQFYNKNIEILNWQSLLNK